MRLTRWLVAALLGLLTVLGQPALAQIEIVDQAGRTVRMPGPAKRIVFSEPGDFAIMAMLVENPASHMVAWNRWRLDSQTVEHWRSIDPAAFDRVVQLALDGPQSMNAEMLIVHAPDLVVLDHFFGRATHTIAQLEQAGIPVAILDLEPRLYKPDPTAGLEKLAILVGQEQRGKEVGVFIRERVERITRGVAALQAQGVERPTVLMEPHAGAGPCCMSMGVGKSMGDLVALAGGRLVGSDIIDDMSGQLSVEYVIAADPQVYIGTGGWHMKQRNGLVLGTGVDETTAAASLARVVQRTGLAQTRAVRQGRAHGIWHGGHAIVHLELIALWLYPDSFTDVDPAATLAEMHRRFMGRPLNGTFWTSLPAASH